MRRRCWKGGGSLEHLKAALLVLLQRARATERRSSETTGFHRGQVPGRDLFSIEMVPLG